MSEHDPAVSQDDRETWTLTQIGAFIFWFSQIESALRHALAEALRLDWELYDAVTASYDFRTLCDVTSAAARFRHANDPTTVTAIEKVISRWKRMNDTRVRIAHGTWQPSSASGFSARHMSRQNLKVQELFDEPQKLTAAVQECQRLSQDMIFFPGGSLDQSVRAQGWKRPE